MVICHFKSLSLIVCNALADGFLFCSVFPPSCLGIPVYQKIHAFVKISSLYFVKCYTIKREITLTSNGHSATPCQGFGEGGRRMKKRVLLRNWLYRSNRLRDAGTSQDAKQNRGRGGLQNSSRRAGRRKENRHGRSQYKIDHKDDRDTIADVAKRSPTLSLPAKSVLQCRRLAGIMIYHNERDKLFVMELEVGSVLPSHGDHKFGAFVAIGEGKSSLVHISEIANTYVSDIATICQTGKRLPSKSSGLMKTVESAFP